VPRTPFRDIKSPLAERPIFRHTERRTEAHIFLCVWAYHLLIAIEKALLDQAIHTSWPVPGLEPGQDVFTVTMSQFRWTRQCSPVTSSLEHSDSAA
jgi:hypothetical protein